MNWSHREIRHLLRSLSNPVQLEQQPLAAALRDAMQANSARDAMISLIRLAIPGSRPADEAMRNLIFRQDLDGIKANHVAALLGLSIRSYFRYREKAIGCIAKALERELQSERQDENQQIQFAKLAAQFDAKAAYELYTSAVAEPRGHVAYEMVRLAIAAGQPVPRRMIKRCEGPWRILAMTALARRHINGGQPKRVERWLRRLRNAALNSATPAGARAAFELAYLERLEALRRCDMRAARDATERITLHALGHAPLVGLALVIEAEQACDDGELEKANEIFTQLETLNAVTREPRTVARTADALSMLALMEMRWSQAYHGARAAAVALEQIEPEMAMCVQTVAGRAACQLGRPWSPSAEHCARYPTSWITAQSLAVQSRHQLRDDHEAARETAERAIAIASDQGASGALRFAQASMGFVLDRLGKFDEAQRLRVEAWESAVRLGRQFYLHDMFVIPDMRQRELGSFELSGAFVDAVLRRAAALCPVDSEQIRSDKAVFFAPLLRHALAAGGRVVSRKQSPDDFGIAQAAAAWRLAGTSVPEGLEQIRALAPILARDLAYCLAFADRTAFAGHFVEVFLSTASECAKRLETLPRRRPLESSPLAS